MQFYISSTGLQVALVTQVVIVSESEAKVNVPETCKRYLSGRRAVKKKIQAELGSNTKPLKANRGAERRQGQTLPPTPPSTPPPNIHLHMLTIFKHTHTRVWMCGSLNQKRKLLHQCIVLIMNSRCKYITRDL